MLAGDQDHCEGTALVPIHGKAGVRGFVSVKTGDKKEPQARQWGRLHKYVLFMVGIKFCFLIQTFCITVLWGVPAAKKCVTFCKCAYKDVPIFELFLPKGLRSL